MNPIIFPSDRALDLIGLGRLCIDLNANEINRPLEETVTFTKYLGGSPANIAVAVSRLGLRTGFIGKVSNDALGRYIMQYLRKQNINTDHISTDNTGAVTGLSITEIKSPTDCSILMYRDNAADLQLDPSEINEAYIKQARAILVSGTALAASPSREAVLLAVEWARKYNVVVFFDIDYRGYTWKSKTETAVYCRLIAEKSDILLGGREEFDILESVEGPLRSDDRYTAGTWFRHHAQIVLVKHGAKGSVAFTRDGQVFPAGTFPATPVKTFGAGDAFAGAFIYSLMQGWSIDRCQQYGSAAASIVVSSHSCSDAMPTVKQIQDVVEGRVQIKTRGITP